MPARAPRSATRASPILDAGEVSVGIVASRARNHPRRGNRHDIVFRFRDFQERTGRGEKAGRVFVYGEMHCCHAGGLSASVLSQEFRR